MFHLLLVAFIAAMPVTDTGEIIIGGAAAVVGVGLLAKYGPPTGAYKYLPLSAKAMNTRLSRLFNSGKGYSSRTSSKAGSKANSMKASSAVPQKIPIVPRDATDNSPIVSGKIPVVSEGVSIEAATAKLLSQGSDDAFGKTPQGSTSSTSNIVTGFESLSGKIEQGSDGTPSEKIRFAASQNVMNINPLAGRMRTSSIGEKSNQL